MAASTRSRVPSLTAPLSLSTADTVAFDTPACLATSEIVGRVPGIPVAVATGSAAPRRIPGGSRRRAPRVVHGGLSEPARTYPNRFEEDDPTGRVGACQGGCTSPRRSVRLPPLLPLPVAPAAAGGASDHAPRHRECRHSGRCRRPATPVAPLVSLSALRLTSP